MSLRQVRLECGCVFKRFASSVLRMSIYSMPPKGDRRDVVRMDPPILPPVGFDRFGHTKVPNPPLVYANHTIRVKNGVSDTPKSKSQPSLQKSHHTRSGKRPIDISIRHECLDLATPKETPSSQGDLKDDPVAPREEKLCPKTGYVRYSSAGAGSEVFSDVGIAY